VVFRVLDWKGNVFVALLMGTKGKCGRRHSKQDTTRWKELKQQFEHKV